MGHADGDIAAAGDGRDCDVGSAALTNHTCAIKDAVLGDTHIRTGVRVDGEEVHADGQGGHVADGVFGRLDAERQDGTITQGVVGLPVVKRAAVERVAEGLGGVAGQVADKHHGGDGVVGAVGPHGIIEAHGGLLVGRHGAIGTVRGANAEVVVVQPVGGGAGADVGISSLVLGTHHGLTEAGAADTPVGSLAAVTHGEEVLVFVGQVVDVAHGELRTSPAGVGAVGGVVSEADAFVQPGIAARVDAVAEFVDLVVTMFFIEVIVGSVPNGGTTHGDTPAAVFASDEEHVVQISRVGHGVLLIFEGLVDHGLHLGNGLSGETAVVHIGELVAVDT